MFDGYTSDLRRLYTEGGWAEVCRGLVRFFYWQSGIRSARYAFAYRLWGSPVVTKVNDVTASFDVTSPTEYARARTHHGERVVLEDLLRTLTSDDKFFDIGANIGTYTCFTAQVIDEGSVVAFEPHPGNVERLRANVALNDIEASVHAIALSNEARTMHLAIDGHQEAVGTGGHALTEDGSGQQVEVETATGDDLVRDGIVPQPTVVKIDVEGAEMQVIEGLSTTLRDDRCRVIYCEVHPDKLTTFDDSTEALTTALSDAGFTLSIIHHRPPEYFIKGTKVTQSD